MTNLTRSSMKKIYGGIYASSSCSCTLKTAEGSASVPVPVSSSASESASSCDSACKFYCENAPGCASYSTVWASSL